MPFITIFIEFIDMSNHFRNLFLLAGLSLSGVLAFKSFRESAQPPLAAATRTSSLRTDLAHKPIEQIRVGDRVVTELPAEAQEASGAKSNSDAERNPAERPQDFRLIRMRSERVWKDGTVDDLNVETIQHESWIEANNVRVGAPAPIPLDLVEMGEPADQQATVLDVSACPKIAKGPGQVVLTTVNHLSPRIVALSVRNQEGAAETIRCTPFHKFYSRTRDLWVSAEELRRDDILDGADGLVSVVGFEGNPKPTRVYNLSVEGEHVYRVSNLTVLVHNNWCEAALRREAELQQRILADRLAELGLHEGGAVGKGATGLPAEAANDPIARGLAERLQEIQRRIVRERRLNGSRPLNDPSGLAPLPPLD